MEPGRIRPWRRLAWRMLAVGFGVAVLVAIGRALAGQDWSVVGAMLGRRDRVQVGLLLGGALLIAAVGPLLGMLSWRAVLLGSGPPVGLPQVLRIFFVGYLGKYVPGKVPGMVAMVKVAMTNGVTLPRMLGTGVLSMVLVHLTGLTVGLLAGAELLGDAVAWVALAAAPVAVLVCWPGLVRHGAVFAMRLLRRPAPTSWPSARGLRVGVAWQCLSWLVSGLHLWLLAVALGAPPLRSLALCVGGFSLAAVAGLLAVVVPDGLGVREAVLLAALAAVLPLPAATVVALASRLVTTVAEVLLGGAALVVAEVMRRQTSRADRVSIKEGTSHA
nr:lysylphosphatidylglycerol synthase domain-containing protein [Micromonospora sp. DSM 115978]